jgi:hypothetical protein
MSRPTLGRAKQLPGGMYTQELKCQRKKVSLVGEGRDWNLESDQVTSEVEVMFRFLSPLSRQ